MTCTYNTFRGEPYTVVLVPLAGTVPACIVFDETGYPTILINSNLSLEEQRKALRHELRHWRRGDVYSDAAIQRIEA